MSFCFSIRRTFPCLVHFRAEISPLYIKRFCRVFIHLSLAFTRFFHALGNFSRLPLIFAWCFLFASVFCTVCSLVLRWLSLNLTWRLHFFAWLYLSLVMVSPLFPLFYTFIFCMIFTVTVFSMVFIDVYVIFIDLSIAFAGFDMVWIDPWCPLIFKRFLTVLHWFSLWLQCHFCLFHIFEVRTGLLKYH